MKGIILAGGRGSRLDPLTRALSKQLLPIYDKPLIYYPLSVLMLAGIREIVIITTPTDLTLFQKLLGNGSQWGIKLRFAIQPEPRGLPDAFIVAEGFVKDQPSCLILGDNIFYGAGLPSQLRTAAQLTSGATAFAYSVNDPQRYGVVQFDAKNKPRRLVEKPKRPASSHVVTGIYFCDGQAPEIAKTLKPSARGELEITDLLNAYLAKNQLNVERFSRGIAWLDSGTPESMMDAANFIATIEKRQGLKVACLEEIAFRQCFIDAQRLKSTAESMPESPYREYLFRVLAEAR